MPELPDVEVLRRYVCATSLRQKIDDVEVRSPEMLDGISARVLRARLKGDQFENTRRHGKYLFIGLKRGPWLALHFGMTGRLAYFRDLKRTPPHTRVLIAFSNGFRLAYDCQRKLGKVALVEDPPVLLRRKGLGPDAFEAHLEVPDLKRLFMRRRAPVKSVLMEQGTIAGIGNIYSDEILFQAGLHPRACPGKLDDDALHALLRALKHVLRIAIERRADPKRLPASWLRLTRQPGGECPNCAARLARMKLARRSAYFCPNCQSGAGCRTSGVERARARRATRYAKAE